MEGHESSPQTAPDLMHMKIPLEKETCDYCCQICYQEELDKLKFYQMDDCSLGASKDYEFAYISTNQVLSFVYVAKGPKERRLGKMNLQTDASYRLVGPG